MDREEDPRNIDASEALEIVEGSGPDTAWAEAHARGLGGVPVGVEAALDFPGV